MPHVIQHHCTEQNIPHHLPVKATISFFHLLYWLPLMLQVYLELSCAIHSPFEIKTVQLCPEFLFFFVLHISNFIHYDLIFLSICLFSCLLCLVPDEYLIFIVMFFIFFLSLSSTFLWMFGFHTQPTPSIYLQIHSEPQVEMVQQLKMLYLCSLV